MLEEVTAEAPPGIIWQVQVGKGSVGTLALFGEGIKAPVRIPVMPGQRSD